MHSGARLLYRNGVLSVRTVANDPQRAGCGTAASFGHVGQRDRIGHAVFTHTQDHPSRSEKSKVTIHIIMSSKYWL